MKNRWQLSMAIALILLFVSSVISCSTPAPIPKPIVIEVDESGLSINKNKFNMDSTLDDYIRLLGKPSRVTELMNTIHTYDDTGIRLYQPPDTNKVISVGIDFSNRSYQFSPKHTFEGVLTIGPLSIDSSFPSDSLRSIPGLTLEDLGFEVYRGTLGSIILIFDYRESRQRLDSLAISFSKTSSESIGQRGQEIEEGWIRIEIKDVGSIDYPTDFLELQSGEYRDVAKEYYQILELGKSDFTLQQVGLNDLLPSAFNEYRRVIFRTDYLNPGEEVFRVNEKYTMSQAELAEFENQLKEQTLRDFEVLSAAMGQEHKLVESVFLEIKEVNGMFPFVYTYKRQLNDNPVVLVKTYLFWNYDKIHHLAFSCRVADEEECRDIYDKILYSFRLQ